MNSNKLAAKATPRGLIIDAGYPKTRKLINQEADDSSK
jgi:hypothetical protein